MVLAIIACLIIIVLIIRYNLEGCDFEDIVFSVFIGTCLCALVVLFMGLGSMVVDANIKEENKTYKLSATHQIVALKDNQGFEGHYYLFGGYSEDELTYNYAEQTPSGIKVNKLKAEDCYIVYTNEKPEIEEWSTTGGFKHWWHYIYAIPINGVEYYKIYVPEGSITTEYEVDLE